MYNMSINNYPNEASFMVSMLLIVSQIDAFKIPAARNIQCLCLIVYIYTYLKFI